MKIRCFNQSGFTLVEMLVVVTIIGILGAALAPNVYIGIEKSKVATTIADYKALKTAIINYDLDMGKWPENITEGNNELMTEQSNEEDTDNGESWNGPYLESWHKGNAFGGEMIYGKDTSTAEDLFNSEKNYVYLKLTNVPTKMATEIKKELDKTTLAADVNTGLVRFNDSGDASGTKTVYLIINEE